MNTQDSWLVNIIERVSARIAHTQHPIIEDDVLDILERNIEVAYPILDSLLELSSKHRNEPSNDEQACLLLICEILAFVHYAIEQDRSWANDFARSFQQYMAAHAFQPTVNGTTLQYLLDILQQTEIEIIDAIRDANSRLIEATHINDIEHDDDDICGMLEDIAEFANGSVYDLYDNLVSQTHRVVPLEVQLIMCSEMLRSRMQMMREAAVLMLLHPEVLVRRHVGSDLLNHIDAITPKSLRRLIVMRNWLPKNEKEIIDRLIRGARLTGIECESWPKSEIIKIMATGFDGIGAQSMLVLSRQQKTYHLAGVLLKETIGIREPMLFQASKKTELNNIVKEMTADSPSLSLTADYLDLAIPHFLAINTQHSQPPSPMLLGFAEMVGSSHWQPTAQTSAQLIENLLAHVPETYFEETNIQKILKRSSQWLENKDFARSWFEHDAQVDNTLEQIILDKNMQPPADITQIVEQAMTELMEPRREKWCQRFLWMAIWAKCAAVKSGPKWQEFFLLGKLINDGMSLSQIPLLVNICTESVYISARDLIDEEEI